FSSPHLIIFFLHTLLPPLSTLFPYTTLFRSDEIHERGLAAARRADDRDRLARLGRERHVAEDRVLGARIAELDGLEFDAAARPGDRKSTRLNSSHVAISYAVFCLKKKKNSAG